MSGIYIPRSVIDEVVACGLVVVEWDGAEERSASKGGFKSVEGVIEHHTADKPPHGNSSWQYATYGGENAPEYNFGIGWDGKIHWLASGGVNSSGSGGPLQLQTGYVPTNGANYRLVAISYDIDGVGEQCSKMMIVSGVALTCCLLRWAGRQPGDTTAHKEYCGPGTTTPGRKIDPFGPWEDGVYGSGQSWGPQQGRIDQFRSQVWWALGDPKAWVAQQLGGTVPEPTPPTPEPPPSAPWWDRLMAQMPVLTPGNDNFWFNKRMQHLLAAAGFMNEGNVANYDGQFGSGTAGALNRFKQAAGGQPDSTCDSWTWGALMHTIDGIPTITKGARGADVKRMQHLLAANGFMNEGNVSNYDGDWGNGTESAKVNFDQAAGLTPSPPTDCGQKSWTALLTS